MYSMFKEKLLRINQKKNNNKKTVIPMGKWTKHRKRNFPKGKM